ncbi:MAG: hypothetical protein ACI9VR_000824 [Cognaticolwellia sp.]|jgi:hypothetical protein
MQWIRVALSPGVVSRAVKVALVVGSILSLVNQGSVLLHGDLADFDAMQGLLSFVVPYFVATYGATSALISISAQLEPKSKAEPLSKAA